MEENLTQLTLLISKLRLLNEAALHPIQKAFLVEIDKENLAVDSLNKLLKNKDLYLNNEAIIDTPIAIEQWKLIKANTQKKSETQKKADAQNKSGSGIIYYETRWDEEKKNIIITFKKFGNSLPTDIYNFTLDISKVESTINEIYTQEKEKTQLIKRLVGIAKGGGISTYTELAKSHLEEFKKDLILRKGSEIKVAYLKELGVVGIYIAFICLTLVFFSIKTHFDLESLKIQNLFLTIAGATIGTWLSFAIRKKEILFDDLRLLAKGKRNPMIRMLVMVLIAVVFYFMFITGFLNIEIGEAFSTKNIASKDHLGFAFTIGIFIGMSETTIGPALTNRVATFTSKL